MLPLFLLQRRSQTAGIGWDRHVLIDTEQIARVGWKIFLEMIRKSCQNINFQHKITQLWSLFEQQPVQNISYLRSHAAADSTTPPARA